VLFDAPSAASQCLWAPGSTLLQLEAKDTDVQGNTTLSITKASAESKQETDAGMPVEGARQTQARDSKSKEAVEEVRKTYHTVVHMCHTEWNLSL